MIRNASVGLALLTVTLVTGGCLPRHAERLFTTGDYGAAIEQYEGYLVRRGELSADLAPILLRLAIAYDRAAPPHYDPERSEHYLRMLTHNFPHTEEGVEAELLLAGTQAIRRISLLEETIRRRDDDLRALRAVLQMVSAGERKLRDEVAGREEEQSDLEGRVQELTRQARTLTSEIQSLEGELEALKRIDLESVDAEPPPD